MWTIAIILAALLAAICVMIVVGKFLPAGHVASASEEFPVDAMRLWSVLTDYGNMAAWRSDVVDTLRVSDTSGEKWEERGARRSMVLETVECRAPQRLVRRIVGENLLFSGQWVYVLEPFGKGTRLTITENGEVHNAFFRFMSRFVIGHGRTMNLFLRDLKLHVAASENPAAVPQ